MMLEVDIQDISKRYTYEWIFKDLSCVMHAESRWAVVGDNGAGKSTFLKLLMGALDPSKGKILYRVENTPVKVSEVFNHISFTAPYMDLIESFSISELYAFHGRFKTFQDQVTLNTFLDIVQLSKHRHKYIKTFSSGMKQRLKLALAVLSTSKMVILDEPTTNLDVWGKEWFQKLLQDYLQQRTLVIASNEATDLALTSQTLNIVDFKPGSQVRKL